MSRKFLPIAAILAMLVMALVPQVASTSTGTVPLEVLNPEPWVANGPDVVYDDITQHVIRGGFLRDYQRFGLDMGHESVSYEEALALTGRPLTSTFDELNPLTGEMQHVQYFERARMEFHKENEGTEFEILRELLGWKAFEAKADMFAAEVKNPAQPIDSPDCQFFPETQHNMCGEILRFWKNNGGVMGLGYPIMEATHETMPDGTVLWVQYTERTRLEEHPENDYPYNVLLGRLGYEFLMMRLMGDGGNNPPPPVPTPTPGSVECDVDKIGTWSEIQGAGNQRIEVGGSDFFHYDLYRPGIMSISLLTKPWEGPVLYFGFGSAYKVTDCLESSEQSIFDWMVTDASRYGTDRNADGHSGLIIDFRGQQMVVVANLRNLPQSEIDYLLAEHKKQMTHTDGKTPLFP